MQIFSFILGIARSKLIQNRLLSVVQFKTDNIFSIIIVIFCFFNQSCSTTSILRSTPKTVESFMMKRSNSILKKDYSKISSDRLLKHSIFLTMTGFGFVMENAEKTLDEDYQAGIDLYKEANKYFERAVLLGNKYLIVKYPTFDDWLRQKNYTDIEFTKDDVEALYWLSAAYGGAVSSSRGNPQWVIHLPKVGQLIEKALELNPTWNYGSLYSVMIPYATTISDSPERDWDMNGYLGGYNRFGKESEVNGYYNSNGVREKEYVGVNIATHYYNLALKASNGMDLSSHVSYAENVLVLQQNRSEFIKLLDLVIKSKEKEVKELELGNYMAKQRAQWLLNRTEELFY